MMDKKELGVWLVDEFDTIVAEEGNVDEKTIKDFLQWFREVYDTILKSDVLKQKGFVVIMAHTESSTTYFKKILTKYHAPLADRNWKIFEIGYRLDETINIVKTRLDSVRTEKVQDELFPFTEDALNELYSLVNTESGSTELIDCRTLERTLYLTISDNATNSVTLIDPKIIKTCFGKAIASKSSTRGQQQQTLSPDTQIAYRTITQAEIHIQNSHILDGIKRAITQWLPGFKILDSVQLVNMFMKSENGLNYNKMVITIQNEQLAGRKKNNGLFQLLFLFTREMNMQ